MRCQTREGSKITHSLANRGKKRAPAEGPNRSKGNTFWGHMRKREWKNHLVVDDPKGCGTALAQPGRPMVDNTKNTFNQEATKNSKDTMRVDLQGAKAHRQGGRNATAKARKEPRGNNTCGQRKRGEKTRMGRQPVRGEVEN